VTFLSSLLLLPAYSVLQDKKFTTLNPDISMLDALTIADSMRNPKVIWIVVMFTFLYSFFAYYKLFIFCSRMGNFEF
jgi:hypothetical protein